MPTNERRMHELPYSNDGRVEQCERICKLMEKVAKELWLLLAMTEFTPYGDGTFEDMVRSAKVPYSKPTTMSQLESENRRLRKLAKEMYTTEKSVLDMAEDAVWVSSIGTLRDEMDYQMLAMKALGFAPNDYDERMIELGWTEVDA